MLIDINLMPKRKRQSALVYYLFIVGLILSILMIGFMTYYYLQTKDNLKKAEGIASQFKEENGALQTRIDKLNSADKSSLKEAVDFAKFTRFPTSILITGIIIELPKNGYLAEYTYDTGEVEIITHLETLTDVSTYMNKLESLPYISNVELGEVSAFEVGAASNPEELTDMLYKTIPRHNAKFTFQMHPINLLKEAEKEVQEMFDKMQKDIEKLNKGAKKNE